MDATPAVSKGGPLPSGTVTFLFTDVEGSTRRWERDRAAMTLALRCHDALLRKAIATSGGHVFKTIGDAFCAAFSRPEQAVAASVGAQRSLAAEDFSAVGGLRVRMALHAGATDERDGDYFGPAVNRVARLLAIGYGGQVLVSGAVADLLDGVLPERSSLRDLGPHRLKDLARPERVHQLVAPGLADTFPALRSLDRLPNNLPPQLTSFVGRDEVVQQIASLVNELPLLTLVGTGGVGKTRCAVQVGAMMLDGSGDGVWLVELAPIGGTSLVASAIAAALGIQESAGRPLLGTLVAYLKRKRLLLILDNCEHVVADAASVAAAIVRDCPEVRILATSREGLKIAGERIYRMPSLSVPPANTVPSATAASQYGALALFVDRARASDRRFVLTEANAPDVTEICRRLDGIPLALELSAARVKILSPRQLLQKLDERFRVLTGGDRSALPRQQTMRALIDWSYDLLSEDERAMFRKLAIFAGGFTLETAAAVCAVDGSDEYAIVDALTSLVDKSLVAAEPADAGSRYHLLESTRQYAREKLVDCGEYPEVARAHAAAYCALAEQLDADWETLPDLAWFALVEPELENWRAALAWAHSASGDVLVGQQLVGRLRRAWRFFGAAERVEQLRIAQAAVRAETPPGVAVLLDLVQARSSGSRNQYPDARMAAERALARCENLGDARRGAEVRAELSYALIGLGCVGEGEALMHEVLTTAQRLGARKLTGDALLGLAEARYFSDDIAGSRARFEEALAIAKVTGNAILAAHVAGNLAEAEFRGGDPEAALRSAATGIAEHRAIKDMQNLANNLCNAAAYLIALDRYDEARTHAREALTLSRDVRYEALIMFVLQHLAAVAVLRPSADEQRARDDRARAAGLCGFADAGLAALGAVREFTEQVEYDRVLAELADKLTSEQLSQCVAQGHAWSENQAVEQALLV